MTDHPWIEATERARLAEMTFEAQLIGGEACIDGRWSDIPAAEAILPGRSFDRMAYDLCDWEGTSLELRGYTGEPPAEAERERIFALGFTVIRIDYADTAQWTSQHNFHGDWSCVKGQAPTTGRPMQVGVERCPRHLISAAGRGQCVWLFGHTGECHVAPQEVSA